MRLGLALASPVLAPRGSRSCRGVRGGGEGTWVPRLEGGPPQALGVGVLRAPALCVPGTAPPPLWASAASFALALWGPWAGGGWGGSASRCQADPEIAVPFRARLAGWWRWPAGPLGAAGGYFGRGLAARSALFPAAPAGSSDVRPPGPPPAALAPSRVPLPPLLSAPPLPPPRAPGQAEGGTSGNTAGRGASWSPDIWGCYLKEKKADKVPPWAGSRSRPRPPSCASVPAPPPSCAA